MDTQEGLGILATMKSNPHLEMIPQPPGNALCFLGPSKGRAR